jgi:hypothetical protein
MIRLEEFSPEHAKGLDRRQELDIDLRADPNNSFTAYLGEEILFCAGVAEYWEGRGEAWALFNRDLIKDNKFQIIKTFKRYLEICPFKRIEASAEVKDPGYNAFLKALGFKLIVPLAKNYLPGGVNASLYEMVKD